MSLDLISFTQSQFSSCQWLSLAYEVIEDVGLAVQYMSYLISLANGSGVSTSIYKWLTFTVVHLYAVTTSKAAGYSLERDTCTYSYIVVQLNCILTLYDMYNGTCMYKSLSLSLSLSHTHTHTHTLSLSLSLSLSLVPHWDLHVSIAIARAG